MNTSFSPGSPNRDAYIQKEVNKQAIYDKYIEEVYRPVSLKYRDDKIALIKEHMKRPDNMYDLDDMFQKFCVLFKAYDKMDKGRSDLAYSLFGTGCRENNYKAPKPLFRLFFDEIASQLDNNVRED